MGSTEATTYDFLFLKFIQSFLTEKTRKSYNFNRRICIPNSIIKSFIQKKYDELVTLVSEQKSRLAFQVFGVFLMRHGAKMTDNVKELILKHSHWEDEKEQLLESKDRNERMFYLSDFSGKIKNYFEGVKTTVPFESPDDIVQKLRKQGVIKTNYPFIAAPERAPIDYVIKE